MDKQIVDKFLLQDEETSKALLEDCSNILDLISNAHELSLCLFPGCTTCGCIPFRSAIKHIGYEKIAALINAVEESDLSGWRVWKWHDPLQIILAAMPELKSNDSFIMRKYRGEL